jgi:hypothetical protein
MKKSILAFILIISAVFCVFGQNSGPIDLVLLLDTSSAMGSSYEKVNDYITGAFLSEFLRTGDTFHLITFSASPRLDIARRISGRGDIETIIGRMLIQYPVETGNDAAAAVNYVELYVSTLPPRPKKIVMVSAGSSNTNNIVSAAKQRLGSKNATLDFVSITEGSSIANLPSSGRPAAPGQASSQQRQPSTAQTGSQGTAQSGAQSGTQGAAQTGAQGAAQAGTQGASQSAQSGTQGAAQTGAQGAAQAGTQGASQTGATGTQGGTQTGAQTGTQGAAQQTGAQATTQPSSSASEPSAVNTDTPPSAQGASSSGGSSDKDGNQRQDSSPGKTAGQSEKYSFNPPLLLIIGITALLLLILLIFLVSRRLGSSPNRVMASVSSLGHEKEERFADHSKDLASYAASQSKKRVTPYSDRPVKEQAVKQPTINPAGPLLLNLFVEDQNTSIGKRNIHSLKTGYSLSVGGGKSDDFLIFLVPVPSSLGEIRRSGSQLTFIPRKPKYFPDIGSNEVRDCINKKIRVVSDKNYEMSFSFVMYEDPLVALNRVLHSINVPG